MLTYWYVLQFHSTIQLELLNERHVVAYRKITNQIAKH